MKIQFSSKNMTVPDRVYSHAEQRINELEPLFRGAPEATVVFSAENGKHVIELTIFSGSTVFRVVEKTSDMMVSIDAAASSIAPSGASPTRFALHTSPTPSFFVRISTSDGCP